MSAPAPGQGGAAVPSSRDSTGFEVPYELRTSAIAGIGVFATTPLARGTLLWRADSRSQVVHTEATLRERLASLSSTEAIELLEHVYCWEGEARGAHMPSLVLEVVGDGKYWNHSRTRQNTGSGGNHPDGDGEGRGDGVSSYALRDIEAGEELLDDYALYPSIPWFEALCEAHGAQSCTSVGKRFIAFVSVRHPKTKSYIH
ncbi:hypothetical protein EMIHUDRAFT_207150 [Emiliania huxleyi CCMP1516]|uniref:SET domain-containing protein n=2 Tax=Emiliania huxleyi TaxID=2903 RepID=A0A0D3JKN2_EMIH1|nr:hypothetical protein EMIHUDRAFT_207150 [Emiliania huxleyi CCMP1516]EOD24067.1 hypothetical protein EMIHUDRAFT_207150 [Emiliania huxleyi CCMP1516]|eukprot:XP_005776496.1 hypothetical protein EMIHUDRAFT_207150 [Emiliania huxleyi CCMP1516]